MRLLSVWTTPAEEERLSSSKLCNASYIREVDKLMEKLELQKPRTTHHIWAVAASAKRSTVYVFTFALVAQTFHIVEHVAQVYQHAILGLSIQESHGILFFLDFEWNHLVFNALYFALLAVVFFQCKFYKTDGPVGEKPLMGLVFNAGFLISGWHVIEHVVRIIQFYQTGCTPCKGILGWFFDGVYLHAFYNTLVYILPLMAFLGYGFHLRLFYSSQDGRE